MSLAPTDAKAFADSPASYFGDSWHGMQHVDPERLGELQLGALQVRFGELRDRIPVLATVAAEQGVDAIETVDDAVPLLLQHSVYKSYPAALLERNRFGPLTKWLDRLTTHDLTQAPVEDCDSIDAWLDVLDAHTEVRVCHSSGTAGLMSFLPRAVDEWEEMFRAFRAGLFQFSDRDGSGDHSGEYFNLVWPLYRHGRGAITRVPEMALQPMLGGDENRLHVLREGRLSSDSMYLAGRVRAAQARGELDRLEINPALSRRREQFEREQRELHESLPRFIERSIQNLRGERVWILATWNVLYAMAKAGLDAGVERVFSPDSLVTTGGGAKGQVVPDDWEEAVKRFVGVDRIQHAYAMTEMTALSKLCDHGH
jgi:hypothetical protein